MFERETCVLETESETPPEVQHRQGWAFPQTFCKEDCYLPSFLHKLSKTEVAMKLHDMGGIVVL